MFLREWTIPLFLPIIVVMEAYDRALRLLSQREHTEKEIRRKLGEKGCGREEIDSAVSRLIAEDSLSEERFAESFIRSRLRRNPEGRSILRMRLAEKGTPPAVADAALEEAWERGDYIKPLASLYSSLLRRKGESATLRALLMKGWKRGEIREAASCLDSDLREGECPDIE